ncbi:hypothetical protein C8Q75DRAFT_592535 [Abortiporus biennis]|nr:hypothetical protein C8Q75DRAFT_592535 [Abortiporus biennis]
MATTSLPAYPSSKVRSKLSPSQQATLNEHVLTSLSHISITPDGKFNASVVSFISAYSKDYATILLESLIWEPSKKPSINLKSQTERSIHRLVLQYAERLSASLNFETLVDLAVVYGSSNPKRVKTLFASSFSTASSSLVQNTKASNEAVSAFTTLLQTASDQGLYGLRKISHILFTLLKSLPKEVARSFSQNQAFFIALAKAYDYTLSSIAQSYGGFRFEGEEDWEKIFIQTKVALIDSFHVAFQIILDDLAKIQTPGPMLASQCEYAFEVVFALLDLPPSGSSQQTQPSTPTPFLNQSLLADYQHAYNLSDLLSSTLKKAEEDPRLTLLESSLRSLDNSPSGSSPGALKIILRSSGVPPGIDNLGKGPAAITTSAKGKGKAPSIPVVEELDPKIEEAVNQVLDILPEHSPEYIRYLLKHPDFPFKGDPERLIGAIFEGTAPSVHDVEAMMANESSGNNSSLRQGGNINSKQIGREEFVYTGSRRNVFENEEMDIQNVRIGKKEEPITSLQDRAYIEEMKADILRRAEEAAYASDSSEASVTGPYNPKGKGKDIAYEDELSDIDTGADGSVRVRDGDADSEAGEDETDEEEEEKQSPETILELAYIRDPKLFDRDANTRRSKGRAELKQQTGKLCQSSSS